MIINIEKRYAYVIIGLLVLSICSLISGQTHSANHIVISVDGSEMTLQEAIDGKFLDDLPQSSPPYTQPIPNPGHEYNEIWVSVDGSEMTLQDALSTIGLYGSSSHSYVGSINPGHFASEVIVVIDGSETTLQNAIDSGEFCCSIPDGTILELHLDEGVSATTFTDSSGENNHGTCSGGTCPIWTDSGAVEGTYLFNGLRDSGSKIELTNNIELANAFTISLWGYKSIFDKNGIAGDKSNYNNGRISFMSSSRLEIWDANRLVENVDFTQPFPLNEWFHLIITRDDSGNIRVYKNKEDVTIGFAINSGIINVGRVGDNPDDSSFLAFDGKLDEFIIWDRVLLVDEIQQYFDCTVPPGIWITSQCDIGGNECGSGTRTVICSEPGTCNEATKPSTSCIINCGGYGEVCISGACVCTTHSSTTCYNGDVYWRDSCGNREELKQDCTASEICSWDSGTDQYICKTPTWHCGRCYIRCIEEKEFVCPGAACSPSEGIKYATGGGGNYQPSGACSSAQLYTCSTCGPAWGWSINYCLDCISSCSCY